jgi:hypothetical protein
MRSGEEMGMELIGHTREIHDLIYYVGTKKATGTKSL